VITFAFAVVFTACEACCIATRRIIIILTVSRRCSFCRRFLTTTARHSSSDGTTLAACASPYTIQTMHSDARSRVWKRARVLDGHGGVCVTTYQQVSSMFSSKGGFRYTAHSNYIRIEILLLQLQLHRRGITGRLTFNGSPPFPPSRDISRPIYLWLHIPVSATHAVGLHYVEPSLNMLSDQYNSYWIRTQPIRRSLVYMQFTRLQQSLGLYFHVKNSTTPITLSVTLYTFWSVVRLSSEYVSQYKIG